MTTNYPNPVDGDVQALIARCQKHLQWLKDNASSYPDNTESLEEDRLIHEVALAALTAETVYQFIANNPDKDGYIEWADCNPDYFSNEPSDRGRILYTKPTDNHFRRIELPVKRKPWTCADCDVVLDYQETVKALISQGYEVKS